MNTYQFMLLLPKHNAGLQIQHNGQRWFYDDVASWLEQLAEDQAPEWGSEEDKQLAIKNNDVWTMYWHPNTPVCSCYIAASSFEKLIELAKEHT